MHLNRASHAATSTCLTHKPHRISRKPLSLRSQHCLTRCNLDMPHTSLTRCKNNPHTQSQHDALSTRPHTLQSRHASSKATSLAATPHTLPRPQHHCCLARCQGLNTIACCNLNKPHTSLTQSHTRLTRCNLTQASQAATPEKLKQRTSNLSHASHEPHSLQKQPSHTIST
jgi:hypothetical protein